MAGFPVEMVGLLLDILYVEALTVLKFLSRLCVREQIKEKERGRENKMLWQAKSYAKLDGEWLNSQELIIRDHQVFVLETCMTDDMSKQNESEVGDDVLLVSDYFHTWNIMSVQF